MLSARLRSFERRAERTAESGIVVMTGWRGLGKRPLLRRLQRRCGGFYFRAAEVTEFQNRRDFVRDLRARGHRPRRETTVPEWSELIEEVSSCDPPRASSPPSVIVLDEFQRLLGGGPGRFRRFEALLGSIRGVAAGADARSEKPGERAGTSLWILSGSEVLTVRRAWSRLERSAAGGGADGSIHFLELRPLDYRAAATAHPVGSPAEEYAAYALFGGVRTHRERWDPDRSVAHNVIRELIRPEGRVRRGIERLIGETPEFRHPAAYRGLLRAVGCRRARRRRIGLWAGVDRTGSLRRRLGRLVEYGMVTRSRRYGARPNTSYRYEIPDPALRFYFEFVVPNQARIVREGPGRVWRSIRSSAAWRRYAEAHLRLVVEQAVGRHAAELGLPPVEECHWWSDPRSERSGWGVDVLAPGRSRRADRASVEPCPGLDGRRVGTHRSCSSRAGDSAGGFAGPRFESDPRSTSGSRRTSTRAGVFTLGPRPTRERTRWKTMNRPTRSRRRGGAIQDARRG